MKIKNKILSYFLLIVFTAISFYFFGFLFVLIYSNRIAGVVGGFFLGIFFGQFLLSIYQKEKIVVALMKSIIYTPLILIGYSIISKNLTLFQLNKWSSVRWFMYLLLIILISEFSSFITNKSIFIARKIFK